MPQNIYIFGHQNPDTDSICSTLSYAYLKKALGYTNYLPCRLGKISKETQFALNYFNVEPPQLIDNVKPQISDLTLEDQIFAYEEDSVLDTMNKIISTKGRSLPVVNHEKKLTGIISLPDIIKAYTAPFDAQHLKINGVTYDSMIRNLDARVIGAYKEGYILGNIYSNSELTPSLTLTHDDIIVTALSDFGLKNAFSTGASTIIIANTPIGITPDLPNDFSGLVLLCDKSSFEVIRLLTQIIPIKSFVKRSNLEYFLTYETLDDVKKNILTSSHKRFPVVDENGVVCASISKSTLLDYNRKKVILMDHNEKSQSIRGIEDAEIIEVIDHHRIAEIQTAAPLYLRIEPLGCTCTIMTKMYMEKNIPIPRPMAGLMLSAILSDTLLFKSPTCTPTDKDIAKQLADIAGVDPENYGRQLLVAGSALGDMTAKELLAADRKHFTIGTYRIVISQINTGDYRGMYDQLNSVLKEMEAYCQNHGFDLALLMVTDIILGGTELIVSGSARELAEHAFDLDPDAISKFIPNCFSRKKQIVPPLMNAASL